MQDDILLAGSIMDNITFFSQRPDRALAEECARLSQIHAEICNMPMGYETFVGEMGNVLSAGQKQRVLLARALYRQPKILAVDEGTSHLDVHNEKRVNQAISDLSLTRLIIAHRPETIKTADRILSMYKGHIREADLTDMAPLLEEGSTDSKAIF
jgi:ATP-binding cassette subfamily B protein RaxB